jgi:hypothetical protein
LDWILFVLKKKKKNNKTIVTTYLAAAPAPARLELRLLELLALGGVGAVQLLAGVEAGGGRTRIPRVAPRPRSRVVAGLGVGFRAAGGESTANGRSRSRSG